MAAKKKYPEPFRRTDSPDTKIYYFMYEGADGKRHRMTTGEVSKERAREFIRTFLDDQRSGVSALTFAEYAKPFYLEKTCPHFIRYRQEGKSIGLQHLSACRSLLTKHVLTDVAFSRLPLAKIKRGDLLDLRSRLLKSGVGGNTVNKCISATKTILSEARYREDIDFNPGSEVGVIKYEKKERDVLIPEEIGALLSYLSTRTNELRARAVGITPIKPGAKEARLSLEASQAMRDEAMIAFIFCTGARAAEVRALRWSAVDLETGRCSIEQAIKGKDGIGLPKWGKVRTIILAKLALDRLKTWKRHSALDLTGDRYVFGTEDGNWIGYEGLHNAFEKAIQNARDAKVLPDDGRNITSHSARHSLNTHLLASGVAPLLVQSFLGWSSAEARILTRVQAVYTHLSLLRVEDVAKAVDVIYAPSKESVQARYS